MTRTRRDDVAPYVTKDGSEIRELMHPAVQVYQADEGTAAGGLSLAEATVPPGAATHLHVHRDTQEVYHVTAGEGLMRLGAERFAIAPGDTVRILPGTPHGLKNTGPAPLVVLCACAPPYRHDDTELLDGL